MTVVLTSSLSEEIKSLAWEFGFDHAEFSPAVIPDDRAAAFQQWCADGLAADMSYMTRAPSDRANLSTMYPGTMSVLSLGISYHQGEIPPKPGSGFGRVARYAWGIDYHDVITERLNKFLPVLRARVGHRPLQLAVDTKPLLERAIAESAGLGFVGKNTMLIVPAAGTKTGFHIGSFVFLAEILLDVPIESEKTSRAKAGCGACERCLVACPTKAFKGPYKLDSNRCIAYLTIENKGWIDTELRPLMGDWLFGCDVCQDVCPFNARTFETRWPEFSADRGAGPWISLREILSLNTADFKARFGSTPLARSKRRGIVRNACVVAGNSGALDLVESLEQLITDDEPVVRGHAIWALSRLSPNQGAAAAAVLRQREIDPLVIAECEQALAHD